jgi:hypothetical protein
MHTDSATSERPPGSSIDALALYERADFLELALTRGLLMRIVRATHAFLCGQIDDEQQQRSN